MKGTPAQEDFTIQLTRHEGSNVTALSIILDLEVGGTDKTHWLSVGCVDTASTFSVLAFRYNIFRDERHRGTSIQEEVITLG